MFVANIIFDLALIVIVALIVSSMADDQIVF